MKGTITIIKPDGSSAQVLMAAPPTLEQLQTWVGGYIELAPHWNTFLGQRCVVFWNEDAKRLGLPINMRATELWHEQMGIHADMLRGQVVIITGDDDLMASL